MAEFEDQRKVGFLTAAQASATPEVQGGIVSLTLRGGMSTCLFQLSGIFSAGTTVVFETTIDNIHWYPFSVIPVGTGSTTAVTSTVGGATVEFEGNCAAYSQVRARCTVYTANDNVTVTARASIASSASGSGGSGGTVEVSDGTNILFTTAHPGVVQQGNLSSSTDSVTATTAQPAVDTSFGTVTNHNSKNSAATLFGFLVSSVNTGLVYFQIHNKASAPVSTNVPLYSIPLPPGASSTSPSLLALDTTFFGIGGVALSLGLSWGISSTNGTFTDAGNASNYNVHVHYA